MHIGNVRQETSLVVFYFRAGHRQYPVHGASRRHVLRTRAADVLHQAASDGQSVRLQEDVRRVLQDVRAVPVDAGGNDRKDASWTQHVRDFARDCSESLAVVTIHR